MACIGVKKRRRKISMYFKEEKERQTKKRDRINMSYNRLKEMEGTMEEVPKHSTPT